MLTYQVQYTFKIKTCHKFWDVYWLKILIFTFQISFTHSTFFDVWGLQAKI